MLSRSRADALVGALDLDVNAIGICHACLWFVSRALESGDEREIRGAVREFAPDLWAEGLALPARLALERARLAGVPDAEAAIAEIAARGSRGPAAEAIVRRLGADLLTSIQEAASEPRRASVTLLEPRRRRP